jgi:hypothetical protein
MVAAKLKLMSREDVEFYRHNPKVSGNGGLVLSKWAESELTYRDLTSALRSEEVRLHVLAKEIELYFTGDGTDVRTSPTLPSSRPQIPGDTFIRWGRHLGSKQDNWAIVAAKLNLMSREDVEFYRSNPKTSGNGGLVLSKWVESELTYRDLTSALRSEEVRLHVLAKEIEMYFGTDV